MMAFHEALMRFWQRFGMPVFVEGCVDDGTPLPYVTIRIVDGTLMGSAILIATSWHKKAVGESMTVAMRERGAFLDAAAAAIPVEGTMIRYGGGYAILDRPPADFLTYAVDAEDPTIIGGRVSYEVRFFKSGKE